MIASAVRNTFIEAGTRLPNSESTPSAKAMSVAVGIAQPRITSPLFQLSEAKISAGTAMPPAAQRPGRTRRDQVESWPSTTSRLISSPTSRKNTAISASLIQCETLSGPT